MTDELSLLRQFRDSIADIKLAVPSGVNSGQWASKKLRELRKTARVYRDQSAPSALAAQSVSDEGVTATYAAYQQRRGRLPDLIEEAIGIYDEWMKDDDYNARGCLDRVIDRLESARDWYETPPVSAHPIKPVEAVEQMRGTLEPKALAAAVLQSACETDPGDPDHPDTIMITCDDLECIVRVHVEEALALAAIRKIDPPSLKGEG